MLGISTNPAAITMTKSRMLTNCTAATSSTTASSRLRGEDIRLIGCCRTDEDARRGSDVEARDQRHVIALSPERARAVAEAAGPVQVAPVDVAGGEEVVQVHAQVHEACRGKIARIAVDLPEPLLDAHQAAVLGQVAVHRGLRRRVEVAADDEGFVPGVALDEGSQRLGLLELVHSKAHPAGPGPELPGERGRERPG